MADPVDVHILDPLEFILKPLDPLTVQLAFAGLAMHALLSSFRGQLSPETLTQIVGTSYTVADAMIAGATIPIPARKSWL